MKFLWKTLRSPISGIDKMKLIRFDIEEFNESKDDKWMLGNNAIYELCRKYPSHKKDEEIRAKIWLIGRSYAAPIERRKIKKHINDDFYDYVTREFIKFNKKEKFDERLNELRNLKFNEENLSSFLKLHYSLTEFSKDITGLEKRSLASKYLHFHYQDFPIYDSRARGSLNIFVGGKIKFSDGVDKNYAQFCSKILFLCKYIEKETGKMPTLREIDTYLIKIANERLIKNKS